MKLRFITYHELGLSSVARLYSQYLLSLTTFYYFLCCLSRLKHCDIFFGQLQQSRDIPMKGSCKIYVLATQIPCSHDV